MRKLEKTVDVPATPAEVWTAWTTEAGVGAFFAPAANIQLRPGGMYEIFFMPDAPAGERGADGCRVLSFLPRRMLSFTWNAPPDVPALRAKGPITWVVVEIGKAGDHAKCRVTHLGWRKGEDWEAMYAYFDRAWDVVLARLVKRFEEGPIDWAVT